MDLLKDCKVPDTNNVEYGRQKLRNIVGKQEKEKQIEHKVDLISREYEHRFDDTREHWKKLATLCDSWMIKNWHQWLWWSSYTAGQSINWEPVKGNTVCKDNHDIMGKMEETCEICY